MNEDQDEKIKNIVVQLAQFIKGGSEAVSLEPGHLYMFDDNEKAVIARSIEKIKAVTEEKK